jgi:hypothetical protein
MLNKREACPYSALHGRVSIFLHQKLNNYQIHYSVHQKLNIRLQKLHTGHQK